ncbi:MAG: 3-deoxy-7-phosphoheptulonate synthase [Treponema sp.]|jgi:3-deoxy-7-phosphoheptulonate synthase|nr:3-deoxy-7-phosphoheptulonate synthase [Treponema sp.]
MIAVVKQGASQQQIENLVSWFHSRKLKTNVSRGEFQTIIGLIGDTSQLDIDLLEGLEIVESVKRISEPFKRANRKFHPADTVIDIAGHKLGGGHFQMIAGPCSVESPEQILCVAESVKASGAAMLRGGAFKPRTSPYAFQGLRAEGIELLLKTRDKTGMPIVTEIMNADHIPLFEQVDVIQVGARNMQNFELLKELGQVKKPILLKRGFANTLQELLMSAEYIMAEGNENVILCERGIRTFETYTRNTLDLSAVPVLKELSHLPVIIDPSHAMGVSRYVKPMALAAVAAGADGLIVEVHNDPQNAVCDGAQSLTLEQFADLAERVRRIREVI